MVKYCSIAYSATAEERGKRDETTSRASPDSIRYFVGYSPEIMVSWEKRYQIKCCRGFTTDNIQSLPETAKYREVVNLGGRGENRGET